MKRTTITMPEQTLARLEREARRKHTSVSAVIRDCVDAKFPQPDQKEPRHIPFAGIGKSDVIFGSAEAMDAYLEAHWEDDIMGGLT